MRTMGVVERYIVGRDDNVIHVDFGREPDPPAPRFPGAGSLRAATVLNDASDAFVLPPNAPNGYLPNATA
jgi:hypothetical protein